MSHHNYAKHPVFTPLGQVGYPDRVAPTDGPRDRRDDGFVRLPPEATARLQRMALGLSLIEGKRVTRGEVVQRALELLDEKLGISAKVAGLAGQAPETQEPKPRRGKKG